jgi:hypothetical protein
MILASSHIAKQIQHSKLANRQFNYQKQRKTSRPLTSGPAACRRHRAGEPGDSSGPRAPSSVALLAGVGSGSAPRKSAGARPSSPARLFGAAAKQQNRAVWALAYMGQVFFYERDGPS